MAKKTLEHEASRDLILLLGGNGAVSREIGVRRSAICNWQMVGRKIPWKHRPALARLAAERAVPLPRNFWG